MLHNGWKALVKNDVPCEKELAVQKGPKNVQIRRIRKSSKCAEQFTIEQWDW